MKHARILVSVCFSLALPLTWSQTSPISGVRAFAIPEAGKLLTNEEINAFGVLGKGGESRLASTPDKSAPLPEITLSMIASKLRLQGVCSRNEVIINGLLLNKGSRLKVNLPEETHLLHLTEISEDSVVVGWEKSDSVFRLHFGELKDPMAVSQDSSSVFKSEEITLPITRQVPPSVPISTGPPSANPGLKPNKSPVPPQL